MASRAPASWSTTRTSSPPAAADPRSRSARTPPSKLPSRPLPFNTGDATSRHRERLVDMYRVWLRRVAGIICVGIAASIAATALASGGAGNLDRSFGDHGKVLTRFKHRHGRQSFGHPNIVPRAYSVLVDSKNRAVAIGTADEKFALARYKPTGRLDRSFSKNGKVTTQLSAVHKQRNRLSRAYAGAIDSHGRIVAVGLALGKLAGERIALARYKPNGHLDRSFGDHGEVRTLVGSKYGGVVARAVAIDSKGRIVVAGFQGGTGPILRGGALPAERQAGPVVRRERHAQDFLQRLRWRRVSGNRFPGPDRRGWVRRAGPGCRPIRA